MKKYILTYIFIFFLGIQCNAVKVTAALDSVNLLMGNTTAIHIEIVEPVNDPGFLLSEFDDYIIPQIEISKIETIDTIDLGNSLRQIRRDIIIQSFDSGEYIIPAFKYLSGKDTIKSNELAIKVMPVDVSQMKTIHPNSDVIDYMSKWYDFLPDFVIDYWIWILLFIIICIAGIYVYILYRKNKIVNPFKQTVVKLSPYEVAIKGLNDLKQQNLCSTGQEKEYYTTLTDILRVYLQDRFAINAVEMTTTQITAALNVNPETKSHKQMIRQILEVADFVKFAKVRPMPEDNVRSFNYALQFVEDKKVIPHSENEEENNEQLK